MLLCDRFSLTQMLTPSLPHLYTLGLQMTPMNGRQQLMVPIWLNLHTEFALISSTLLSLRIVLIGSSFGISKCHHEFVPFYGEQRINACQQGSTFPLVAFHALNHVSLVISWQNVTCTSSLFSPKPLSVGIDWALATLFVSSSLGKVISWQ